MCNWCVFSTVANMSVTALFESLYHGCVQTVPRSQDVRVTVMMPVEQLSLFSQVVVNQSQVFDPSLTRPELYFLGHELQVINMVTHTAVLSISQSNIVSWPYYGRNIESEGALVPPQFLILHTA